MRVILNSEVVLFMEYVTEQKTQLLNFLKENSDCSYSIEEISEKIDVGKSTIYRLMPKLLKSGSVKRFSKDTGRKFVYQYINCDKCTSHLHMKCLSCGQILHMDGSETDIILKNIMNENKFSVDKKQTIIYGECEKCINNGRSL